MIRRCVAIIAVVGMAGCAATVENAPPPAADVPEPAVNSESPATDDELEVASIPKVPKATSRTSVPSVHQDVSAQNEIVCRREMRTGTHRAIRVCRTRAEIERIEIEGKDTFKELHRSQVEYER